MMKKIALVLLIAISIVGTAWSGGQQSNAPAEEMQRPFIAGTAELTGEFHAGWGNSTYDKNIRQLVWAFGLMEDNSKGEIVDSPMVVKKTVSNDLTEWTFEIKDGITFHNGEEMNVSDIKFTYEFYMDKDALTATGATSNMSDYVDSISIDEAANKITFKLKKVIFTTDMSVFYETWILPEDTITAGASAAGQTVQEYVKANISNAIGYGPYKIVEYVDPEYVKLTRFDDYIGKAPAIKDIIVKYTPSETELDQLLQGEVDLLERTVEAEKIEAAKDADFLTTNNYFRHGGGTVVLHTDYEAFALTEVRQAFAFVFNRPAVIDLFLGEYGIASQGPYSKNHWMMYDDDEMDLVGTAAVGRFESELINYDILDENGKFDEDANIAKANELLDKAVARTDGEYANLTGDAENGYMWKGERLEIKVTYTAFWSDTYNLVWNADYLSKLSFDVTLHALDWPVMYGHWIGDTTEERQYHAFVGGIGYVIKANPKADYGPETILPWGQPSNNGPRFTGGNTYTEAEWLQLMEDIENCHPVTGADEYRTLWRKFVSAFNKEVPIIPVYSNNYHDLYTSDLENFNTNALWPWTRAILDANWK